MSDEKPEGQMFGKHFADGLAKGTVDAEGVLIASLRRFAEEVMDEKFRQIKQQSLAGGEIGGGPSSVVTSSIAAAALHLFDRGGRSGGEFSDHVFHAIAKADTQNRERLRTVYPAWVRAYEMGHNETYGIDRLAEIAGAR